MGYSNDVEDRETVIANALGSTARELLPVSADAAAQVAAKALDYAGPRAVANSGHVTTAVEAYLASGQLTLVIDLLREVLDQPLPEYLARELTCTFAQVLVVTGQPGQAVAAVERALDRRGEDDVTRATLLLSLSFSDPTRAGTEATRLLSDRGGAGRNATAVARATLADLAWQEGEAGRGLQLAADAAAAADDDGVAAVWRLHTKLVLASKLSSMGEHAEAETVIRQASAEATRLGPAVDRALSAIALTRTLTQAGRLTQAREEAERALRAAGESDASMLIPRARCALAATALRMGDLAGSDLQVRQCQEKIAAGPVVERVTAQCTWLDIQLAAERHGPRRAASLLARADPRPVTCRSLLLDEPGAAAWFVRLGIAVRNRQLASSAVTAAEQIVSQNPGLTQPAVAARHARGLLDQDAEALGEAAAGHRDPWARAWAIADLAECLAARPGAGPGQAVQPFQDALDIFERMNADRDAARIRDRLHELGVQASSAQRAKKAWARFSPTEQTVIVLAGQGMTNGQIAARVALSPHTVNYHLRRIFRALDIRSRVELAAIVQHLQLKSPFSGS